MTIIMSKEVGDLFLKESAKNRITEEQLEQSRKISSMISRKGVKNEETKY